VRKTNYKRGCKIICKKRKAGCEREREKERERERERERDKIVREKENTVKKRDGY